MITLTDQIAEARRALALRRQCSPRWIKAGTLDSGDAKHQLACMDAILQTLMELGHQQRQLPLFTQ